MQLRLQNRRAEIDDVYRRMRFTQPGNKLIEALRGWRRDELARHKFRIDRLLIRRDDQDKSIAVRGKPFVPFLKHLLPGIQIRI